MVMSQYLSPNASEEQRDRASKWLRGETSNYPKGRPRRSRSGTGAFSFMREDGKTCKDCGREFIGPFGVVRCINCRENIAEKKMLAEEAYLSKQLYGIKCPWCGTLFFPHRKNQTYCTKKCRIKHNSALRIGKKHHNW